MMTFQNLFWKTTQFFLNIELKQQQIGYHEQNLVENIFFAAFRMIIAKEHGVLQIWAYFVQTLPKA